MYPGGYQIIDCSAVTVVSGGGAVTVTDGDMARKFRTNKPIFITGLRYTNDGVTTKVDATGVLRTSTGAHDGNVNVFTLGEGMVMVTTDGNTVTFGG